MLRPAVYAEKTVSAASLVKNADKDCEWKT
jgi:hypothetical protein